MRYYTLQILTALLTNSQNRYGFTTDIFFLYLGVFHFSSYAGKTLSEFLFRLQEAILTIPRGITRLMDMLMDREVQNSLTEQLFLC